MSNANNTNNNYINASASTNSPILHNNHIINNNHQHLHQSSNMNYGIISGGASQMLNNEIQSATAFYQQQHPFTQHQRGGVEGNTLISGTVPSSLISHSGNGLAQHMKSRGNRLMKNNGLNNNFYRSSGILVVIVFIVIDGVQQFVCVRVCVYLFFFNLFRFCV
jgi:hypothetical protein